MRNDLILVCENCALRLPSTEKRCPTCARDLRFMRDVADLRTLGGMRPYRALLLFTPVLPSLAVGVLAAVDKTSQELSFVPVLQALFFFDFAMLIVGLGWIAWAAIVMVVSAIWNALRSDPLRVVVVPRARQTPLMPLWTVPNNRGGERIQGRDLVPAGVLTVLGMGLSIAGFARSGWPPVLGVFVLGTLSTLLVVFGCMLLAWIVWWVRASLHEVGRSITELRSPDLDLADLCAGRGHASGRVRAGDHELIAPLSGQPCLAFRIAGRMADVEIDDALAAPMFLESEKGTLALSAQRWLVAFPIASRTSKLDGEQRVRIRRFIESRGLRFTPDVEIGEAVLDEGDTVDAFGTFAMAELSDSDGKPLVLQPK